MISDKYVEKRYVSDIVYTRFINNLFSKMHIPK